MSETLTKMKKAIIETKKFSLTLSKVVLLGLLIRILLIPFSLAYDANFWTIVVRNINASYGLYEMEGYYYTPVWGYILGFVSRIQNFTLDVGDASLLIPEFMPHIGVKGLYCPIAVNIVFLLVLKVILTISDLILSMLVYYLVKERTNDEKKSTIAFLLVFLCPVILVSSSITVMPDTLSVMFAMMTIFAIKKEKMFTAGVCYSLAVWIKFFPISIAFLLISYLFILNKNNIRGAVLRLITAIGGFFVCSLIIFIPQVLEGRLIRCFDFLYSRLEFLSYVSIPVVLLVIGIIVVICIVFVVRKHVYRSPKLVDDMLMEYSLVILGSCMIHYTLNQYTVHMIPFLVYCMLVVDMRKCYRVVWVGLSISGLCSVIAAGNTTILNSLVRYTGLISTDTVMSLFDFLHYGRLGNVPWIEAINNAFERLQKSSVVLVLLLFFVGCCYKHTKNNAKKDACIDSSVRV